MEKFVGDAVHAVFGVTVAREVPERFADWLTEKAGDRLEELEEIVGYHLEQACRYRDELGLADHALAERAGAHLAATGRRALWRSLRRRRTACGAGQRAR